MKSIIFLIYLIAPIFADESVLCPLSYCDGDDIVCDELPAKCKIQNATHNGVFLLSPQTCNCCQYCLENLNEGEDCSIGDPASGAPTTICGPGLSCQLTEGSDYDGKCKRMVTACTTKQDDYDNKRKNGTLGSMEARENCDDDGLFSPYKCIPGQTCYCVHKNGSRIFGESDFTTLASLNMQCKCSRDYVEAVELTGKQLGPGEHFRCAANGDYDNLQCLINSKEDQCLFVDAADGAPTYPNTPTFNISLIAKDYLTCDDGKKNCAYYKNCEAKYIEILKEVIKFKDQGYDKELYFDFPNCDLDGTYKPVQENTTHKFCVSKEGTKLTVVDKNANKTLADSMDCKCLRAVSIMTTREKPTCSENGNYSPIQCRRGICRCVDLDGNQICSSSPCEVDENIKDTLKC